MKFIFALTLSFLFLGCGNVSDKSHRAAPLTTLTVNVTGGAAATWPVKLALVWYRGGTETQSAGAVGTEEGPTVTQGPARLSFDIESLPPAAALITQPDGSHFAVGFLLAYRDGNKNGKLDITRAGALAVDTALSSPLSGNKQAYLVVYSDASSFIQSIPVPKGFTALHQSGANTAVPTTSVEVVVSPTAWNDTWICADESDYCKCHQEDSLFFYAQAGLNGTGAGSFSVIVNDCKGPRADASVYVNGMGIPYHANERDYEAMVGASGLVAGGNTLDVSLPGMNALGYASFKLEPLIITSPMDGQTVPSGTPLAVTWTDADPREVIGYCFSADNGPPCQVTGTSAVVSPVPSGPFHIIVSQDRPTLQFPSGSGLSLANRSEIALVGSP